MSTDVQAIRTALDDLLETGAQSVRPTVLQLLAHLGEPVMDLDTAAHNGKAFTILFNGRVIFAIVDSWSIDRQMHGFPPEHGFVDETIEIRLRVVGRRRG